jgi:hypothetical protein
MAAASEARARAIYRRAARRAGRVPAVLTIEREAPLRAVLGGSPLTVAHVARFDASAAVRRVALLDLATVARHELTTAIAQQSMPADRCVASPPRPPLTFRTGRVTNRRYVLTPPEAGGPDPQAALDEIAHHLSDLSVGLTADAVIDHDPALTERGRQELLT